MYVKAINSQSRLEMPAPLSKVLRMIERWRWVIIQFTDLQSSEGGSSLAILSYDPMQEDVDEVVQGVGGEESSHFCAEHLLGDHIREEHPDKGSHQHRHGDWTKLTA